MVRFIDTKEEQYQVMIESHYHGDVKVWYTDNLYDTRIKLATYSEGKWNYKTLSHMNKFIALVKHDAKVKRELFKCFNHYSVQEELPVQVSWKCFKRRVKAKVQRLFIKWKLELEKYK